MARAGRCRGAGGSPTTASRSRGTTPARSPACPAGRRCSPASTPTCTASPRPTASARTPTTRRCAGCASARCRRSATGSGSPATTPRTTASGTCRTPTCTTPTPAARWRRTTTPANVDEAAVQAYLDADPLDRVRLLRLDRPRTARRHTGPTAACDATRSPPPGRWRGSTTGTHAGGPATPPRCARSCWWRAS